MNKFPCNSVPAEAIGRRSWAFPLTLAVPCENRDDKQTDTVQDKENFPKGRTGHGSCVVQMTLMIWSLLIIPDSHAHFSLIQNMRDSRLLLLYKRTAPLFSVIAEALGTCSSVSSDLCLKHLTIRSQGG